MHPPQVQRRVERLEALLARVRRNRRLLRDEEPNEARPAASEERSSASAIPAPAEVRGASTPPSRAPTPLERSVSERAEAEASVSISEPPREAPEPELEVSVEAEREPPHEAPEPDGSKPSVEFEGEPLEPLAAVASSGPIAKTVRHVDAEPVTFGALLDASLSLRPR